MGRGRNGTSTPPSTPDQGQRAFNWREILLAKWRLHRCLPPSFDPTHYYPSYINPQGHREVCLPTPETLQHVSQYPPRWRKLCALTIFSWDTGGTPKRKNCPQWIAAPWKKT